MTAETAQKKLIKQYLNYKGIFYFYILQGIASYKGAPDLIALKQGMAYAIEVKAEGGKISMHQKKFHERWVENGGVSIIGGYDEVRKFL